MSLVSLVSGYLDKDRLGLFFFSQAFMFTAPARVQASFLIIMLNEF